MPDAERFDPLSVEAFRYVGFDWDEATGTLHCRYALEGGPPLRFTETFQVPGDAAADAGFEAVAKLLWLAAGLSYYKAATPATVVVDGPGLTPLEASWAAELLTWGLGELAATNDLDLLRPRWEHATAPPPPRTASGGPAGPPLVAVGGGKDSCVAVEALAGAGFDPVVASVKRLPVIDGVMEATGRPVLRVGRSLDPVLLDLNQRGARNGHVPVTAVVSLALVLAAQRNGCSSVVMSLERSASEQTVEWRGEPVNHQWSKSLAAEERLSAVLAEATGGAGPSWFSLLRPFSELAITRLFAHRCEAYFQTFSSCNAAFRLDPATRVERWDGTCAKCQFVALALAPWLEREVVTGFMGHDVLDDPRNVDGLLGIVGAGRPKPFECVGEVAESRVAVRLAADRPGWSGARALRAVADRLGDDGAWPSERDVAEALAPDLSLAHLVPPPYRPVVEELAAGAAG